MASIARLQAYLRHSAQQQYDTVSVEGFDLFFHPTDGLTYFNYAIPSGRYAAHVDDSLSLMRREFAARGRRARLEYIEEFALRLAAALRAAGFDEEARQQLMVCTAQSALPAPEVPGVTIAELTRESGVGQIQEFLALQRCGFDPSSVDSASLEDAAQLLRTMGEGRAFVARLASEPAGVGMTTAPFDGVTEVVGLATLERYRRRGIATALTAHAVERALGRGADTVCLVAADERAGRVYQRVGFSRCATMLAYIDSADGPFKTWCCHHSASEGSF